MKKPPLHISLFILLGLCVLAGSTWLILGPELPTPKHEMPEQVRVKVEQPETQITLPVLGDESPFPEVAASPPPVSEEPAQPPQQVAAIKPPPVPEKMPPHSGPPKIAVVIDDLGLDIGGTKRAMNLPAFVTLSFMPYATRLKEQTKEGRDDGHELLLHMPMEPIGHDDPGPGALLVGLPPDEIRKRFEIALASFTGFDGVNNHMGSKFTSDAAGMEIVIDELQQRGLFFLDSRTSGKTVGENVARAHGLPTIGRDIFLDDDMSIAAVRNEMEQAERVARRKGEAVAIGHPHPVTLQALEAWLPEAEARGFIFVPLHDLIAPPPDAECCQNSRKAQSLE